MKQTTRPPIGLRPKYVHDEARLKEVRSAIERYCSAELEIPVRWVEEYNALLRELKGNDHAGD